MGARPKSAAPPGCPWDSRRRMWRAGVLGRGARCGRRPCDATVLRHPACHDLLPAVTPALPASSRSPAALGSGRHLKPALPVSRMSDFLTAGFLAELIPLNRLPDRRTKIPCLTGCSGPQDEIDESMTSELFEDAFPGAGHPSVARKDCGLALKHAHSLPGLSNTQDNKRKALSPVGRTYSGALQVLSFGSGIPPTLRDLLGLAYLSLNA